MSRERTHRVGSLPSSPAMRPAHAHQSDFGAVGRMMRATTPIAAAMAALDDLSEEDLAHLLDVLTDVDDSSVGSVPCDGSTFKHVVMHGPRKRSARRYDIERRSRRRREMTRREMRDEVKRLEAQFSRLKLALFERSDANDETLVVNTRTQASTKISLLKLAAQRLVAEEYELKQRLLVYQQCTASLRRLVALRDEDGGVRRVSWEDRVNHLYKAQPIEEILRVLHECLNIMCVFELSTDFVSSGMTFLGWRDRRRLDEASGMVQFGFSKFFPGRSAQSILASTWDFYTSSYHMTRGAAAKCSRISLRVVETLNSDTFVVQQLAERPKFGRMLAVFVICRLRVGENLMLVVRSLPMQSFTNTLEPQESWVEMSFWLRLSTIGDGTEAAFEGVTTLPPHASISDLLIGSFDSAVWWENACVTPTMIVSESS